MDSEILIGIITRDRPEQLFDLLDGLESQVARELIDIVVVDNDPSGSASAVVERMKNRLAVQYVVEPRPGVAHARNCVLQVARSYDALVFLDDDEEVTEGWLRALLAAHRRDPHSVITGLVKYRLPDTTPGWIVDGGFFERPDHPDGATLSSTGTGNTLIPMSSLKRLTDPQFDTAFSLSGGEDTDFFGRLAAVGVKIVWARGAVVLENVSPERATWEWLTQRYERTGNVHARIALRDHSAVTVYAMGATRIAVGWLRWCARRTVAKDVRVRDIATFFAGKGYIRAARGQEIEVYGE